MPHVLTKVNAVEVSVRLDVAREVLSRERLEHFATVSGIAGEIAVV